jgi:gp32 DNA binding protein like
MAIRPTSRGGGAPPPRQRAPASAPAAAPRQRAPAPAAAPRAARPAGAVTAPRTAERPVMRTATSTVALRWKEQPREAAQVRARATRRGGRFDSPYKDGVTIWRPKQGDSLVRILPQSWESEPDQRHYAYRVWQHRFVGPDRSNYICLRKQWGKLCAICDAAQEARDSGDEEQYGQLAAKEMWVCYILDRQESPETPVLWEMSMTQDKTLAAQCSSEMTGETIYPDHPDVGYDLTIRREGAMLMTRYTFVFSRGDSPIFADHDKQVEVLNCIWDNPIPDLLVEFDNDYLQRMISGTAPEQDEELDDTDTLSGGDADPDDDSDDNVEQEYESGDDEQPPEDEEQDEQDEQPPEDEEQDDGEEEEAPPPPPPPVRRDRPVARSASVPKASGRPAGAPVNGGRPSPRGEKQTRQTPPQAPGRPAPRVR